ncbi:MAG: threonine-phosphate decarboxylase [Nitrospirae bacterium]|nr:threonine-phosphate decarboxylase [Nitrospirota bacterium]
MTMHGGDVYSAADALKIPVRNVIDFSASVNPLGPSKKVKAAMRSALKELGRYPDSHCRRLVKKIARVYGIDPTHIVCGNGSNELIHLAMAVTKPKRVLVTAPAFAEYERAARLVGAEIVKLPLAESDGFGVSAQAFAEAMKSCDAAFLCNPGNPAGTLMSRADVLAIAAAANTANCLLIIDEAFMDFCRDESVIRDAAGSSGVIVLRSLTKYHSLAGLRIGFGLFPPEIKAAIAEIKDPWSVNALAEVAAITALSDRAFAKDTAAWLSAEKKYMGKGLAALGFKIYPSEANFFLVKHELAQALREHLYRRGILLRDCSNFDGLDISFLRIAIRGRRENARLLKEMKWWFGRIAARD